MTGRPDLLIVGAGPTGCTIARAAAARLGWRSVVVDRRAHIAGLCHDQAHPSGVLVHSYGPHYFRTDDAGLVEFLSEFTDWIPGRYIVKTQVDGRLYPFPINLTTLEMFYDQELDPDSGEHLLDSVRDKIDEPRNAEEWVCSRVGREIYEKFYLGYTSKQWDRHPSELDKSICGRVPVRLNRDERYVNQRYQLMPSRGFTEMFKRMLDHSLIETRLETPYEAVRDSIRPRVATVYSGAIDEYFDYRLGPLPWRSLEFRFESFDREYVQPCVQINYPNEHEFTRTVEIKHVTGQKHEQTVVCYEFPRSRGDPYYPVLSTESQELHAAYQSLASSERERNRVYMAGRLGHFCYINSDQAISRALELLTTITRDAAVPLN